MLRLLEMDKNINKNSRGNLLIIAGSDMYPGAATLSALGALRAGAGLVFVATTHFAASSLNVALSEAIPLVCDTKNGAISFASLTQKIEPIMQKIDAIVLGPGLSRTAEAQKILQFVATEFSRLPKVFDADALFYLKNWKPTSEEGRNIIITPHLGEASNLLGKEVTLSYSTAVELIIKTNCHVYLKGHESYIAIQEDELKVKSYSQDNSNNNFSYNFPRGKVYSNQLVDSLPRHIIGSPSLAVAGSGDVLAGAIGALLARTQKRHFYSNIDTFLYATYLAAKAHAEAGISLEEKFGVNGNLASEIANELPRFLNV